MSLMLGRLFMATIAGWLIYSWCTRNAALSSSPTRRQFATQLLGSALGAIAFAWLFAPLTTVASDDLSMQFLIRGSGILACAVPVLLLYLSVQLFLRKF